MNEATMQLARELRDLVPLNDRRWDGARLVSTTADEAFRICRDPAYVDGMVHMHGTVDDWGDPCCDLVPDLDDPATRGCVLRIVRKVLGWTYVVPEVRDGRARVVAPYGTESRWCTPWSIGGEAAALVAAIREAKP